MKSNIFKNTIKFCTMITVLAVGASSCTGDLDKLPTEISCETTGACRNTLPTKP